MTRTRQQIVDKYYALFLSKGQSMRQIKENVLCMVEAIIPKNKRTR